MFQYIAALHLSLYFVIFSLHTPFFVTDGEQAARDLLLYGLRLTEPAFSPLAEFIEAGGGAWQERAASPLSGYAWLEQRWLVEHRARLLQFLRRLETYAALRLCAPSGRDRKEGQPLFQPFVAAYYQHFRVCDLVDAALERAACGNTAALFQLFTRHPRTLLPHRLRILRAIPETLPPHSYAHLLPVVPDPDEIVDLRLKQQKKRKSELTLAAEEDEDNGEGSGRQLEEEKGGQKQDDFGVGLDDLPAFYYEMHGGCVIYSFDILDPL